MSTSCILTLHWLHRFELSSSICSSESLWAGLFLLEGDLLNSLVVVTGVTSSWKIANTHGFRLRGDCEVVVEFAISGVGGKASHKEKSPSFMDALEEGDLS